MSVTARITITDYATPSLEAKLKSCSPERARKLVRGKLEIFFRGHLEALPANKRGWPSRNFYKGAADSVKAIDTPNGIILRADKQGLMQRWKGGPITPQAADALTIPVSSLSYGKFARDFPGLFLLRTPRGAWLVQRGETVSEKTGRLKGIGKAGGGNAGRRKRANLNFLFRLSKGVNQKGNPKVIPTEDEFAEVALAALEEGLK